MWEKSKKTTECDKRTVTYDVETTQYKNETVKYEKKKKKKKLLGHMCFSCYRTYVMILYNWLILWQNALYLYLGRLRMCLTTSRNHVLRSSIEAFKSVQEIKQEVQIH